MSLRTKAPLCRRLTCLSGAQEFRQSFVDKYVMNCDRTRVLVHPQSIFVANNVVCALSMNSAMLFPSHMAMIIKLQYFQRENKCLNSQGLNSYFHSFSLSSALEWNLMATYLSNYLRKALELKIEQLSGFQSL